MRHFSAPGCSNLQLEQRAYRFFKDLLVDMEGIL